MGAKPQQEVEMNIRMLLGGGLIVLVLALAMLMGGSFLDFCDVPSLLLVFGITIGATVWSHPFADLGHTLSALFSRSSVPAEHAHRANAVRQRAADASVAAGTIGTVIGLVQMLRGLEDPSAIGPAMAVALLTIL